MKLKLLWMNWTEKLENKVCYLKRSKMRRMRPFRRSQYQCRWCSESRGMQAIGSPFIPDCSSVWEITFLLKWLKNTACLCCLTNIVCLSFCKRTWYFHIVLNLNYFLLNSSYNNLSITHKCKNVNILNSYRFVYEQFYLFTLC